VYCPNRSCPDFQDDGIPGEYVYGVTVCPKCGAALVPEWSPAGEVDPEVPGADLDAELAGPAGTEAAAPAPPPAGPLVAVAAFDEPDETEPLTSALLAAGLSVYQFFDDGRDFADAADLPACTRVLVPHSQAGLAKAILGRLEDTGGA
jgi:hypothetical protein